MKDENFNNEDLRYQSLKAFHDRLEETGAKKVRKNHANKNKALLNRKKKRRKNKRRK